MTDRINGRDHHHVAERGDPARVAAAGGQRGAAGAGDVEQHPAVDVVRREPRGRGVTHVVAATVDTSASS
ncbi:MAG TPA: hypothetical protein VIJ00_10560 [Nakamurella sp.]